MEIAHNEFARLTHVAVKHARDAFGSQERLAGEWQAHGFTAPPDFAARSNPLRERRARVR